MWRGWGSCLVADVSRQPTGPIFKGLGHLDPWRREIKDSRKVGNQTPICAAQHTTILKAPKTHCIHQFLEDVGKQGYCDHNLNKLGNSRIVVTITKWPLSHYRQIFSAKIYKTRRQASKDLKFNIFQKISFFLIYKRAHLKNPTCLTGRKF